MRRGMVAVVGIEAVESVDRSAGAGRGSQGVVDGSKGSSGALDPGDGYVGVFCVRIGDSGSCPRGKLVTGVRGGGDRDDRTMWIRLRDSSGNRSAGASRDREGMGLKGEVRGDAQVGGCVELVGVGSA